MPFLALGGQTFRIKLVAEVRHFLVLFAFFSENILAAPAGGVEGFLTYLEDEVAVRNFSSSVRSEKVMVALPSQTFTEYAPPADLPRPRHPNPTSLRSVASLLEGSGATGVLLLEGGAPPSAGSFLSPYIYSLSHACVGYSPQLPFPQNFAAGRYPWNPTVRRNSPSLVLLTRIRCREMACCFETTKYRCTY